MDHIQQSVSKMRRETAAAAAAVHDPQSAVYSPGEQSGSLVVVERLFSTEGRRPQSDMGRSDPPRAFRLVTVRTGGYFHGTEHGEKGDERKGGFLAFPDISFSAMRRRQQPQPNGARSPTTRTVTRRQSLPAPASTHTVQKVRGTPSSTPFKNTSVAHRV
eukprot:scaffold285_cov304-Pinguiococcus_pyrenoidosus.AAC.1